MKLNALTLTLAILLPFTGFAQDAQKSEQSSQRQQPKYEERKSFSKAIAVTAVRLDGRWRLLNKQSQQLLSANGSPIIYDKVEQVGDTPYIKVIAKGKGYLLDHQGIPVAGVSDIDDITPADDSRPARYFGLKKSGKIAIWDRQTGKQTDFVYDYIVYRFTKDINRLIFSQNDLDGVLDKDLNERLPATAYRSEKQDTLDWLSRYNEKGEKKWGVVMHKTAVVLPPIYDDLTVTDTTIFAKKNKFYWDLYDATTGKLNRRIDFPVADLHLAGKDDTVYFTTIKDGKAGLVDIDGNIVIPHRYENFFVADVDGGKPFFAKKDGYYGLIDFDENVYIPFEYEDLTWYSTNKVVLAEKDEKWQFMTIDGKPICDWQTGWVAGRFDKDLFVVKDDSRRKMGIVDTQCQFIMPIAYQNIKTENGLLIGYTEANEQNAVYRRTGERLAEGFYRFEINAGEASVYGLDEQWHSLDLNTDSEATKPAGE